MNPNNFEDEVYWRMNRYERLHKIFLLNLTILSIYLAVVIFYFLRTFEFGYKITFSSFFVALVPAFALLTITLSFYLQKKRYQRFQFVSSNYHSYEDSLSSRDKVYKSLEDEIDGLKNKINEINSQSQTISDEEKKHLVGLLEKNIEEKATDNLLKNIINDIERKIEKDTIEKKIMATINRLKDEVGSLGGRGNLNLILGIATTLAGLAILAFVVFSSEFNVEDPFKFVYGFLPKLSLVIFIEVFAYFFLNLYKSSLSEIKYFQNELTNIESKFISLQLATKMNDQKSIENILDNLVKTERNQILKKGESTVELEIAKNSDKSIIEALKALGGTVKIGK